MVATNDQDPEPAKVIEKRTSTQHVIGVTSHTCRRFVEMIKVGEHDIHNERTW
jgi:hypothetical protein